MHCCDSPSDNRKRISFRDPGGRLLDVDGRILRAVNKAAVPDLKTFLESETARAFVGNGRMVDTRTVEPSTLNGQARSINVGDSLDSSDVGMIVEHDKISFPTFPYEWSPEMLHSAGHLTLDLASELLDEGLGLKDATPYNVLFRGPEAVFIDVLSFERRDPVDPTWLPYGQFVRTFLLPLLANKHFGVTLQQIFTGKRDGLEHEDVGRFCSTLQSLRPPFLSLITIPGWLASRNWRSESNIYQKRTVGNPEQARFILRHVLSHLRKLLDRVEPSEKKRSVWSNYMSADNSYSEENFKLKSAFVDQVVEEFKPAKTLDVGCNTGFFSSLAAEKGSAVVAIDSDPAVVGEVYRTAHEKRLNVLPLAVDLTRASPAVGWRNRECPSFLDRACGQFDAVFMLAVLHHMIVTERIPLAEVIELSAELTNDLLVIEFVHPEDPMFKHLTRGRESLFSSFTRESFERTCARYYDIVRSQELSSGTRRLYLMRRKKG